MEKAKVFIALFFLIIMLNFVSSTLAPENNVMQSAYESSLIQNDPTFAVGDANSDGSINEEDVNFILDYIFNNGNAPQPLESADYNQDGTVDISDAVSIINYLHKNEYIKGDVNNDRNVNSNDVYYLIDYIFNNGPAPNPLLNGDANNDGSVDISDAVYITQMIHGEDYAQNATKGDVNSDESINQLDIDFLIAYIFNNGPAPNPLESGDADEDGVVDISDVVYLVNFIYRENHEEQFLKGDANNDGKTDKSDAEFLIAYIFNGGPEPPHFGAGDFDNSGSIDISDVVALTSYLNENNEEVPLPDTTAPIITIYNPETDITYKVNKGKEKQINFEFKVSDESEIEFCELIIDNNIESTIENADRDITKTFEKDFVVGNYNWKIKCVDINGNIGFSEEREFYIEEKSNTQDLVLLDNPIDNQLSLSDFSQEDFVNSQNIINLNSNSEDKQEKTLEQGFNFNLFIPIFLGIFVFIIFGLVYARVSKHKLSKT